MFRPTLAIAILTAAVTAQDHLFPLGFAGTAGPPNTNAPVARIKDANLDGIVTIPDELHLFMSSCFHTTGNNQCFMTDGRAVLVDGEYEFYFTDSEEGRVVRGVDRNHNGVLDPNEVTQFFLFGERVPTATNPSVALFAPDTLGVYHDATTGQTRVYVALDNGAASSLGFTHGIHRLVDLNGDGDASDPGEWTLFVSSTMGLQVPGNTGPVTIDGDFWRQVRVLPGGKVVAFAQGTTLTGVVDPVTGNVNYTVQAARNAWFGFTDNNGTAVPSVWFDPSTLNNLPDHPDFQNGTFPNWDVQFAAANQRANFVRFLSVVPSDPLGLRVFYIGSSYRTTSEGAANLVGQQVGGLIYRVLDLNQNDAIDPGELTLFANISGSTYANVPPVSFVNLVSGQPVTTMAGSTWGMDAATDGSVHILFENSSNHAVISMRDADFNGRIDQNEIAMVHATTTFGGVFPNPYQSVPGPTGGTGPFFTSLVSIEDGTLPGPMPAGVTPSGEGCLSPGRGFRPVLDVWGGAPSVGNGAFQFGAIRCQPFSGAMMAASVGLSPVPVPLQFLGFAPDCLLYLQNASIVSFVLADVAGRAKQPLPLPPNPVLIGASLFVQGAVADPASTQAVPFYTTNALRITVQP